MYPYNGFILKYLKVIKNMEALELSIICELTGLKGRSLYNFVNRRVKDNTFIKLKKGMYTTTHYFNRIH